MLKCTTNLSILSGSIFSRFTLLVWPFSTIFLKNRCVLIANSIVFVDAWIVYPLSAQKLKSVSRVQISVDSLSFTSVEKAMNLPSLLQLYVKEQGRCGSYALRWQQNLREGKLNSKLVWRWMRSIKLFFLRYTTAAKTSLHLVPLRS